MATFAPAFLAGQTEYREIAEALVAELQPATPTERFLVQEMALSQWRMNQVAAVEVEILHGGEDGSIAALARWFQQDCSKDQVLMKLTRYEESARRAWHKALNQLRSMRAVDKAIERQREKACGARLDGRIMTSLATPSPLPLPRPENCDSKPIPAHLQRELDAHRRRDPLFDPDRDRSQMSKQLQRYFAA